jgi:hypothetical protein
MPSQTQVFGHGNEKVNQKNGVVAVTEPDHVVVKPLELVCKRVWMNLEKWAGKSPRCCKLSLMSILRSDQNADRNADNKDCSSGFRWE